MKPPLQAYDKHPDADAYKVGGSWSPYCLVSEDKRFSDAELAAEYEAARCDYLLSRESGHFWAPLGETWPSDNKSAGERASILLRFATRDHFDEEPV